MPITTRPIAVYFQSWSANWTSTAAQHDLAKISSPVNMVFLAFVNPTCSYKKGQNSFSGTGIDFSADFAVVKGAIALARAKGIKVMLSVGGATYGFSSFNPSGVAQLAQDLGADGVDLDWEDSAGTAAAAKLGPIIKSMRAAYPASAGLLSMAGFSVGAYGQGDYKNSTPASSYTGMDIAGIKECKDMLDFIGIMAYDAGNSYDTITAISAYRSIFNKAILVGYEVPPEAWGGHVLSLAEIQKTAAYARDDLSTNGIFVWSYQKAGSPSCTEIIATAASVLGTSADSGSGDSGDTDDTGDGGDADDGGADDDGRDGGDDGVSDWVAWKWYAVADRVLYGGIIYRCVQAHTSQPDWAPNIVPALWSPVV